MSSDWLGCEGRQGLSGAFVIAWLGSMTKPEKITAKQYETSTAPEAEKRSSTLPTTTPESEDLRKAVACYTSPKAHMH